MAILEALEEHLPKLSELSLEGLVVENTKDITQVQGRVAERLVETAIRNTPEVQFDFPAANNGFSLKKVSSGIIVLEPPNYAPVCEYDFLVRYADRPYIIEVKSLKLYGFRSKIPFLLSVARKIYDRQDVGMIICFPFSNQQRSTVENFESLEADVHCFNLRYNRKQIKQANQRYYNERAVNSHSNPI